MILTEERSEMGEWEKRENNTPSSSTTSSSSFVNSSISSTCVSSSTTVVCVGEEFPEDCVADVELQTADNHDQSITSIITTTTNVTSTSTSSSSSFASGTYTFTRDAGSPPSTKPLRTCRVCGDKAKSMHFGGLSCDSCKAFFRRAVHNDTFANFTCPYDGTCVINITSRKCCQYCRYQKCMSIGMERSWVMSEEDRQQLMRQRAERKAKAALDPGRRILKASRRELVPFDPDPSAMLTHMTPAEWKELEQAVRNYRHAYTAVPYSNSGGGWEGDGASLRVINMFSTVVRRFAHFARLFPEFCALPEEDQSRLLRYGILEMSLIRGVQSINTTNDPWPSTPPQHHHHQHQASPPPPPTPPTPPPPVLGKEEKQLVSYELLRKMHVKFVNSMRELGVDEAVLLLLLLVVLFSSDRPGLQAAAAAAVQARQDYYLQLLRKYLGWRHGPHNAPILYPRLLLKLTDLRELNDQHTEYHLRLARQELAEIQTHLGYLNLNPYAEWPNFMSLPQTSPGPHTATPGPLVGEKREAGGSVHVNMNPQSATSTPTTASTVVFKGEGTTNPLSSAILASLDLECLVNSPAIQRLILHQFQRSVMNVLGLAGMFPETKPAPSREQPSTDPTSPHSTSNPPAPASLPTQTHPHVPQMSPNQVSLAPLSVPHSVTLSAPQQNILQGFQVADLMAHLDNLTSTSQPQGSHTNRQQQEQSEHAFQQLEQQLMNGITGHSGGGLVEGHNNYQQQQIQQQQQQQEHQSCHYNQLAAKQMEERNCSLREGLVTPKQEPMSSPMFPAPAHAHYDHPLMYDDLLHPPHHPHHHQDAMDSTQPSGSVLDLPELEKFQQILDHKESPSFDSPSQQKLLMMTGQLIPHHHHQSPPSSPPQMMLHHSQPPPTPQLQQSSPSMHHTPGLMQFSSPQESQGYQMTSQNHHTSPPHHHFSPPHSHLYNHTPFTSSQGCVSHVEGGVGGGDSGNVSPPSTYSTEILQSSPPPPPPPPHSQHHLTTSENFAGFCRELQHRATPPQNTTITTTHSSPPPHFQHPLTTPENFAAFCRELQHRSTPPGNTTVTTTQSSSPLPPPPQFQSHHHQPLHHHQHHHQEFIQRVPSYS